MRRLLDAPTYRYIQGAMLVVLAVAFVTSFESGSAGALRLGYPAGFTAALPLVCDVIAGVATFIHGRVRTDPPMRRLAAQFVLVPMLLSWGANSVDHVTRAPAGATWQPLAVTAWIAAVVVAAGICPVAVAALLHLSTKYVEFEQRQTAVEPTQKARVAAPSGDAATRPTPAARGESPSAAPAGPPKQGAREPVTADDLAAVRRAKEAEKKRRQRASARARAEASRG